MTLTLTLTLALLVAADPAPLVAAAAAYDQGNFESALDTLQQFEASSSDKSALARAELLRARCYAGMGKMDQVSLAFAKALSFDPEVSLDPVKDPPDLVARLGTVRSAASAELVVRADGPGTLWIDNLESGSPPFRARVAIGRHRVDLRQGATVLDHQEVVLFPDQSSTVALHAPVPPARDPKGSAAVDGSAASAPKKSHHQIRVVVLDFPPEKALGDNGSRALNEFLANDLRQQGLGVITTADVIAALGIEKQKQLLGCTDSSCLAELGGALGSDYIARGSISVLDSEAVISLSMLDSKGLELNRVGARSRDKSVTALLNQLEALVPNLVQPLKDAGKLSPTTGTPTPPIAAITTSGPAVEESSSAPGYLCVGLGAAASIGGALLIAQGVTDTNAVKSGYNTASPGSTDTVVGSIVLGAGVVAIGVGIYLLVRSPDAPGTAPSKAIGTTAAQAGSEFSVHPTADGFALNF